jgi:hypothetical protein
VFSAATLVYAPWRRGHCSRFCQHAERLREDFSGCIHSVRGDWKITAAENCEPTLSIGSSCPSNGYGPGTLRCGSDCKFDFSGCAPAACGDGVISGSEECDGAAIEPCIEHHPRNVSGVSRCTSDCKLDFSDCRDSVCGDGKLEGLEECEGTNLGVDQGKNCHDVDERYLYGARTCVNCVLDSSQCGPPIWGFSSRFGLICY